MIKAVFFDIDGTLVSLHTHEVPQDACRTLERMHAAGIKLFIATGRNRASVRPLMERFPFDGAVLLNGQLCELAGETIFSKRIAPEDLEICVRGARDGRYTLGFLTGGDSFVNRIDAFVTQANEFANMRIPEVRPASDALGEDIYQLHFYGEPGSEAELIGETQHLVSARWSPLFADVYPEDGGKARGMQAVLDALGLDAEACMAFGDGENDVSMLEFAGIGVAMGNSSGRVMASADYVTRRVDAGGISAAASHFADILGLDGLA